MICQSYRIYKGNRYCPNHIGFTKEIVLSQPYRNYKGNHNHYDDIGYLKEISIARLLFYYTKQSSTGSCVHTPQSFNQKWVDQILAIMRILWIFWKNLNPAWTSWVHEVFLVKINQNIKTREMSIVRPPHTVLII